MEYVLKTSNLTKQFDRHLAADHVSLTIRRGEIYGFIGKNGAGKTTFMKMISGLSSCLEQKDVRPPDITAALAV